MALPLQSIAEAAERSALAAMHRCACLIPISAASAFPMLWAPSNMAYSRIGLHCLNPLHRLSAAPPKETVVMDLRLIKRYGRLGATRSCSKA